MIRYIFKRILLMIPVIIGVITLVFTILYFSDGDVVDTLASEITTETEKEQMRRDLGLDRPYIVQLADYIWNLFTKFDLGNTIVNKSNIAKDLSSRYPNSIRIALGGMIFSVVIGIPLGVFAALHQGKIGDTLATCVSLLGVSTPGFWAALMLVIIFSYKFPVLPALGTGTWQHWVLPIAATSLHGVGKLTRQARSSVLEVIRSDYVMMAKSKGLSSQTVIWKHVIPNALMPLVTTAGMTFGTQLGGGLVIERVFSIPGVGGYLTDMVNQRDTRGVLGGVVMTAIAFCTVMLLCDLLMAFIDPRIKARYASKKRRKKNA